MLSSNILRQLHFSKSVYLRGLKSKDLLLKDLTKEFSQDKESNKEVPGYLENIDSLRKHPLYKSASLTQIIQRKQLQNPKKNFCIQGTYPTPRETSGTTGKPVILYSDELTDLKRTYFPILKIIQRANIRLENKNKLYSVFCTDQRGPHSFLANPLIDHKIHIRLSTQIDSFHFYFSKLEPEVLIMKPDLVAIFLNQKIKIPQSVKAILCSGASVSNELIEKVANTWNAPLINYYSTTELGLIASPCEYGRKHFFSEIETIGLTEEEELILSRLENKLMPLYRYNTGDIVKISKNACRCGKNFEMTKILGRKTIQYAFNSGKIYLSSHFSDIFNELPGLLDFELKRISESHFYFNHIGEINYESAFFYFTKKIPEAKIQFSQVEKVDSKKRFT